MAHTVERMRMEDYEWFGWRDLFAEEIEVGDLYIPEEGFVYKDEDKIFYNDGNQIVYLEQ